MTQDDTYDFVLYRSLWFSVLEAAAADLEKKGYDGNISRHLFYSDSGEFKAHFDLICDLAGIDPSYVKRKLVEFKGDAKKMKMLFHRHDKFQPTHK